MDILSDLKPGHLAILGGVDEGGADGTDEHQETDQNRLKADAIA